MSKVRQKRRTLNQSDKEEIGLQCCNCGSTEDLQYHHIIPISIGGKDINSNMCCLCHKCHYKLHHNGKESKVDNFGELIKRGQARAQKRGIHIGATANEVTVIFNDDRTKVFNNAKDVAEYLNCGLRSVQHWCKGQNTKYISKQYGIKNIYYSDIRCYNSKSYIALY